MNYFSSFYFLKGKPNICRQAGLTAGQAGHQPEGSGPQPAQTGARPGEHAHVAGQSRDQRVPRR